MTDKKHILVVEDDEETRLLLSEYLEKNQYRVSVAEEGNAMWQLLNHSHETIHLIVMDIMLPGEDGLTLCRDLCTQPKTKLIPIIMLTARGDDTDRIIGLEMGADDYLAKPFNPRELLARIKSVLRRTQLNSSTTDKKTKTTKFLFSGWILDSDTHQLASPEGVIIPITKSEFELLMIFLHYPRQILDRDQIMDRYRQQDNTVFDRSIDVQISRIRRRLYDNPKKPKLLQTVWGKGYYFDSDVTQS